MWNFLLCIIYQSKAIFISINCMLHYAELDDDKFLGFLLFLEAYWKIAYISCTKLTARQKLKQNLLFHKLNLMSD